MSISWRCAVDACNTSVTLLCLTRSLSGQELRAILAEFDDGKYTNMTVTAFNILRYDPSGRGGLSFHIDMVRAHLFGILLVAKQAAVTDNIIAAARSQSCPGLARTQDFYPLQRWRRMLTLRSGLSAATGELEDMTSWRSLTSARADVDGYVQPELGRGETLTDFCTLHHSQTRFRPLSIQALMRHRLR